jgi:hypothetical protein
MLPAAKKMQNFHSYFILLHLIYFYFYSISVLTVCMVISTSFNYLLTILVTFVSLRGRTENKKQDRRTGNMLSSPDSPQIDNLVI